MAQISISSGSSEPLNLNLGAESNRKSQNQAKSGFESLLTSSTKSKPLGKPQASSQSMVKSPTPLDNQNSKNTDDLTVNPEKVDKEDEEDVLDEVVTHAIPMTYMLQATEIPEEAISFIPTEVEVEGIEGLDSDAAQFLSTKEAAWDLEVDENSTATQALVEQTLSGNLTQPEVQNAQFKLVLQQVDNQTAELEYEPNSLIVTDEILAQASTEAYEDLETESSAELSSFGQTGEGVENNEKLELAQGPIVLPKSPNRQDTSPESSVPLHLDDTSNPFELELQNSQDETEISSPNLSLVQSSHAPVRSEIQVQTAPVVEYVLPSPIGYAQWQGQLSEHMMTMAADQIKYAKIALNPPNLGPLEVHLTLEKEKAQILFLSPHQAVRETVEASSMSLSEAFQQEGFTMQMDVASQQSENQERAESRRAELEKIRVTAQNRFESSTADTSNQVRRADGSISYYV